MLGRRSTPLVINCLAAELRVALKDTQVTVGCLWFQTVASHIYSFLLNYM